MSIIRVGKFTDKTEAIGVDKIRELLKVIFLKQAKKKTFVIENAHNLTAEAQNALLKTLEEPPENVEIVLETKDEDLLLPTIRSRCEIIYSPIELKITDTILPTFNSIPERLALAKEKSSKKDEALKFVDELLSASEENLSPKTIRALFKAKKYLKSNSNVRLVLENLFLNW